MYWEISRVARGKPKTFTYSTWDEQARMMYHVDMAGDMVFEKLNLREERIDLLQNPLLGPLLRRKETLLQDKEMTKQANVLAIYYLNLHKRYDLDVSAHISHASPLVVLQNYLQYKAVTGGDWLRAAYYTFMTTTGLADTYRNEQFMHKAEFQYEFERKMILLNAGGPDNAALALNYLTCLDHEMTRVIAFLKNLII